MDSYEGEMVDTLCRMISIKAISPKSGGSGELRRAEFLEKLLKSWGLKIKRFDYKDETGTLRPNIITEFGSGKRRIWLVAHMDTVTEGDLGAWKTDPFIAKNDGKRIYGRGAEDDGKGLVSSMYALKALKESGIKMKYSLGLALVSDEELGSKYGMLRLMDERIFKKKDMFVVPDFGFPDGSAIEIGEKGVMWFRVTVKGVQVHASVPERGKNAFRYAIKFLNAADRLLHSKYTNKNKFFIPSISTFEMTKREKNVDSVNIIPGSDVSYIDCRLLPEYDLDDVIGDLISLSRSREFGDVKIKVEVVNRQDAAPMTKPDSEIVNLVKASIKEVKGINARLIGLGGHTDASLPRKTGMQAVAWCSYQDKVHQANEYCLVKDLVGDAKVFTYLFLHQ
jgi:succinyl-diaminopimelate desuccinylase